ncbi:phosphonate ABC transporter ATP-binding protein, partial [Phytoactinopolyspora endophytica]|uniref:phosphonate ABC transporter ATP-binding protein n=1 Tax=Phytoactinopolyspora endophytica TaxID=1642495 RepID=UPI00197B46A7
MTSTPATETTSMPATEPARPQPPPASTSPVVDAQAVRVTYGSTVALDGVDLTVGPGEVVVLLGHSGSGKSTLLKSLTGMAPFEAERMLVAGHDVAALASRGRRGEHGGTRALRAVRSDVGHVFQHFNLVSRMSSLTNVLTGGLYTAGRLSVAGIFPRAQREKAIGLLDRVGLVDQARQQARTLSGGQQQRVAIARALMQDPKLILADEPVASLDPRLAGTVLSLLRQIASEQNVPVVVSLHVVDLARRYGDRVVGLRDGHVVFTG